MMLALRTAFGFSLSCGLCQSMFSKLQTRRRTLNAAFPEPPLAIDAAILNCRRETRAEEGYRGCCCGVVSFEEFLAFTRRSTLGPPELLATTPIASTPPPTQHSHLRPRPRSPASPDAVSPAVTRIYSTRTPLATSRHPHRLEHQHALRYGPELGEVPEELRRRRGRGEEDHAPHR
jgi:hypothetical protein